VSSPQILDKVYKYAFVLMMQNQGQRSADKAMCIEFWKVLLSAPSLDWSTPSLNWLEDWIQFVTNHNSLKTVSRDQWNHVLKFARLSLRDPTLGFHNEEQSWPSVIDEYVEHIKKLRVAGKGDVEMEL
jgi:DCN1-like protein 1/2